MPAGPALPVLEVGLPGVHPRVEVTERLGDRLDALPVRACDGVQRARRVVVAGRVEPDESLGLLEQLRGLVLDVGRVVGVRLCRRVPPRRRVGATFSSDWVTVKPPRMPSPFMPGLHAVT